MNDSEFEEALRQWQKGRGICRFGKEETYFKPANNAEGPGHIYSEAGVKELEISGFCEYHYDRLFAERD